MTEHEALEKAADQYRKEGYAVTVRPGRADLPSFLTDVGVDLLARKGTESVAVQVKRRDELYDVKSLAGAAAPAPPGWRYDLVVVPVNGADDVPPELPRPDADHVKALLTESERLLDFGSPRAAFLIAWSAAEAVLREASRREGLGAETAAPRPMLDALYSNGVLSREEFDHLKACLDVRNRLVHGLPYQGPETDDTRFLIELANRTLRQASPLPANQ
jgi:hypothetical protein